MHFEKNKQDLNQYEIGNELFDGLRECNFDHTKEYRKNQNNNQKTNKSNE